MDWNWILLLFSRAPEHDKFVGPGKVSYVLPERVVHNLTLRPSKISLGTRECKRCDKCHTVSQVVERDGAIAPLSLAYASNP